MFFLVLVLCGLPELLLYAVRVCMYVGDFWRLISPTKF